MINVDKFEHDENEEPTIVVTESILIETSDLHSFIKPLYFLGLLQKSESFWWRLFNG